MELGFEESVLKDLDYASRQIDELLHRSKNFIGLCSLDIPKDYSNLYSGLALDFGTQRGRKQDCRLFVQALPPSW